MSGLLRVFLRSADGRQVTVRYVRDGDVAGLLLVLGGPGPTSIQAMTSASVAALQVDTLRSLLASDPRVARVCAGELTRQLYKALEDLSEQAFLPVRERLVHHLLELASTGDDRHLLVRASQQELAEAIGSVREVVTRTLHRLREEGLVETSRDGIVLLDPLRLSEEIGAPHQKEDGRLGHAQVGYGCDQGVVVADLHEDFGPADPGSWRCPRGRVRILGEDHDDRSVLGVRRAAHADGISWAPGRFRLFD